MNTALTATQFPALAGDVVTEAHARICREKGHATHTVDGVDTGICPRCGDRKAVAKFEQILDLEAAVRMSAASITFRVAGVSDYRAAQQEIGLAADRARLFTAIDALTSDEARAFGAYRMER